MERVVITDLKDSTYFARLILKQENELGKKLVELDARPSDCLALAAATKRPVFVSQRLFDEVEDMSEVLSRINSQSEEGEIPPNLTSKPAVVPESPRPDSTRTTLVRSLAKPTCMASPAPSAGAPLLLVCGDDDFSVKQRSRQVFDLWCKELGGMDHEIVDASAQNTGEALAALSRLREGLDTLPFFGGSKVIWFQNCTFLGDDRTAKSNAVIESLLALSEHLKTFRWDGVRLLVSAGRTDERRVF